MGRTKNAVLAVAVTGLLLASLFFLFPSTVQAARVTGLAAGGISAATNGDFTVTATITVPEGEHIPIDPSALEVWTRPASESQDADLTNGDGTQCSGATLVSIDTDLDLVHSDFTGYGYGVADIVDGDNAFGYGYSYGYSYKFAGSTGYELDGAGYGYGYGSTGGDVRVTIRATGCTGVNLGGEPFKPYEVQVLLGQFASLPLTVTFVDPAATGTASAIADASGFSIVGGPLATGTTLTIPMDLILDGTTKIVQATVAVTSGADLPAATKFVIVPATPNNANPAFGVSAGTVTAQFGGRALAFHFQMHAEVNGTVLDLNGRIRVVLTVSVPDSYFTGIANANKNTFLVRGFDTAGNMKANQPSTGLDSDFCATACDPWQYDITITHFSSYAGAAAVTGGGGGGGGGGTDTDTTTTTTTTTGGPGDGTGTGSPGDGTGTGGPGDGTGTGGPGDGTGTGGPGDGGGGGGPNWGLIIVAIIAIAAVIGAAIFFVMRGKP